jgi:hypothetical protein
LHIYGQARQDETRKTPDKTSQTQPPDTTIQHRGIVLNSLLMICSYFIHVSVHPGQHLLQDIPQHVHYQQGSQNTLCLYRLVPLVSFLVFVHPPYMTLTPTPPNLTLTPTPSPRPNANPLTLTLTQAWDTLFRACRSMCGGQWMLKNNVTSPTRNPVRLCFTKQILGYQHVFVVCA